MFLNWRSVDWSRKGDSKTISPLTTCPYQLEGLHAYARRQARIFLDIHDHFSSIWKGLKLPQERLDKPIHPIDLSLDAMELDGEDI